MMAFQRLKVLRVFANSRMVRSCSSPYTGSIPASFQRYGTQAKDPEIKIRFPTLPKEWKGRYVKGQMYKYQDSLPKFPVPPLEQTLKDYIDAVKPLVTNEEFTRTCKIVEEFGKPGGVGEQLQKKLQECTEKEENWLNKEYFNNLFLRGGGYLFTSTGAVTLCEPCEDQDSYVRRVAAVLLGLQKMHMLVQNEALVPDVYHNKPQCMMQYKYFSKCRIPVPSEAMDYIRATHPAESRHAVIIRNGHFYKLDLMYECPDGTLTSTPPDHLMKELHGILQAAPETCEHPVGALTSGRRDLWHNARQNLLLDPVNKSSFEAIETALFVCNLDKPLSSIDDFEHQPNFRYWDRQRTLSSLNILHGLGCKQNGYNRWYHFGCQIIIGEDGISGILMDQANCDGTVGPNIMSFFKGICSKSSDVLAESSPVPNSALTPFQKLEWNISPVVKNCIQLSKDHIDRILADVETHAAVYTEFGSDFAKKMKISIDGLFHMALLLAYYRVHKKITAIHELASLREFCHGRITTIHAVTNEALILVKLMEDPNASSSERVNALLEAIRRHSQKIQEVHQGRIPEIHLFGLALMAQENQLEVFADETYKKFSPPWRISSSQIRMKDSYLVSGSKDNGYCVCEVIESDRVTVTITSSRSCQETDSLALLKEITECMTELKALLSLSK